MYEKQKVAFTNKEIFGTKFSSNIDTSFCTVSKMLFANIINIDGSIDMSKVSSLKKEQLWSYIYYMFYFNNKNEKTPEFVSMKTEKNNKANAVKFYEVVLATVQKDYPAKNIGVGKPYPFDENTLVYFINIIVHKYNNSLVNPVIDYLNQILSKEIIPTLGSLSIKTGNNSGTGNNVTIITDPAKMSNANVKVNFKVTEINNKPT